MSTVALFFIGAMVLITAALFIYEEIRIRQADKEWRKKLDEANAAQEQQEANNAKKEEMETGSAIGDFNASIDILQHLNRSDKK